MKKIVVAAVLVVGLVAGAFFAGAAVTDPTDSTEYQQVAGDLDKTKEELDATQGELDDVESRLLDAEAQVDALTSEAPAGSSGGAEPAVSGGAALAPRNIKLAVRTRSKKCFGSAGCLVEVQVEPSYVGNQDVTSGSWEITYELRGGEDGPVIETMELVDGTWSFPSEQNLDTPSSGTVITAVVTAVYPL